MADINSYKAIVKELDRLSGQTSDPRTSNSIAAIAAAIKNIPIGGGFGIPDAPNDGKQYGRQSRAWTEIEGGGVTMAQVNAAIGTHDGSTTAHADIRAILQTLIGVPTWDGTNYILTFTAQNGSTLAVDLPLESLAKGLDYDADTKEIVLTKQDGSTIRIDVADLIDVYLGSTGTQIQITIGADNTINATLLTGTIDETLLTTALLAKINGKAEQSVVDGKMNQFTISPGTMEEPQGGLYPALYITTQMPQAVLDSANGGNWLYLDFNSDRHYDDGHFQGEFAHIGNEFVFQENYGWNYTDGFSLAYDDATGDMTRWSPCSSDTHFVTELDAATGYIKITPRDTADILSFGWQNGLVYVPSSAAETFDGIDLYNKMVAEKLETDVKLSDLEARILALENA